MAPGAERVSGVDMLLDLAGLDANLSTADLVVTGEGRLDGQTLSGKAPAGVLERARRAGIPVVAVCGTTELSEAEARAAGFTGVGTLQELEPDPARCLADPAPLLHRIGEDLGRQLSAG